MHDQFCLLFEAAFVEHVALINVFVFEVSLPDEAFLDFFSFLFRDADLLLQVLDSDFEEILQQFQVLHFSIKKATVVEEIGKALLDFLEELRDFLSVSHDLGAHLNQILIHLLC